MLKSYLSVLLRGGKKRENCYLYAVGMSDGSNACCLHGGAPLPIKPKSELLFEEVVKKRKELISLFEKIVREKKWTVEEERQIDYDENRKQICWDALDIDEPEPIVSETIITKKITTYYIDDALDIKELKRDQRGAYIKSKKDLLRFKSVLKNIYDR